MFSALFFHSQNFARLIFYTKGGYNVDSISSSALACTRVLLGESPPQIEPMAASPHVTEAIRQVELIQSHHWKCITPQPSDLASCEILLFSVLYVCRA